MSGLDDHDAVELKSSTSSRLSASVHGDTSMRPEGDEIGANELRIDMMSAEDPEKARPSAAELEVQQWEDLEPDIVFWDGPTDLANPQKWSTRKKGLNITVISAMTFMTPLASSMFAPGVPEVMKEFNTDR